MNRRQFLQSCLKTGAVASLVPSRVFAAGPRPVPSNRIALGFIGLGGHGVGVNLNSFLAQGDAQVVALCDVDGARLASAATLVGERIGAAGGGVATTKDWREVVERRDVDAVVVSTPDHWHVLPALAAARRGKDVFCEKPMSLTVQEGRVLSDTVRQYGRVFQTASENRSKGNFLRACELVRNGRIGNLHTIRTQLPHGSLTPRPAATMLPEPVPADFDYDMWLGQAPEAPYCAARCHGNFRWIFDYSGGYMTDWGAHLNDVAQWGNDTERTGPVSVEGHGIFPTEGLYNTAVAWEVLYEYANGVRLICNSGTPGIRFEGSKGWLHIATWDAPVQASSDAIRNAVIGPGELHLRTCEEREHRDFLNCVKSREATYAPAEVGHRSATVCHLGNIAMLLGRKLRWDPAREQFPDDDQANAMLSRVMRAPWSLWTV